MKSGKREEIEQPNQESIRTLRLRKNFKCLGILQGNTTKQAEMKEKNKKRVPPKEWESFWKPRSAAEISLKG